MRNQTIRYDKERHKMNRKRVIAGILAALLCLICAGCGNKGKDRQEEAGIKTAAELTAQSGIPMPEPDGADGTEYQMADEKTAQLQYKDGAAGYTLRGAMSADWKTIAGTAEEFIGEPEIRMVKCNGDRSTLEVYTSAENHRAGTWSWNDARYVLITQDEMEPDAFINECLEWVRLTYAAWMKEKPAE